MERESERNREKEGERERSTHARSPRSSSFTRRIALSPAFSRAHTRVCAYMSVLVCTHISITTRFLSLSGLVRACWSFLAASGSALHSLPPSLPLSLSREVDFALVVTRSRYVVHDAGKRERPGGGSKRSMALNSVAAAPSTTTTTACAESRSAVKYQLVAHERERTCVERKP